MPSSSFPFSRRSILLFTALAAGAGALSISACSSDSSGPGAGTLAVTVTPVSINLAAGGTGTAAVSVTRGGSFAGDVTLSQSGAPTGITVTFTPGTIVAGSTTSTIAVVVDGTVAPGNNTITITAAGTGVTDATATLTVVVVGGGVGSFALSANPTTLTTAAGAAAVTSAITITRAAPFTGAVALSVSGAPTGVTASVDPASATGNTATLSVQATASAAIGTYPLVVRGTAAGLSDATTTVSVTVTGSGGGSVSVTYCTADDPIWVAAQDGNGAWTRVLKNAGTTTYQFSFPSGKGGVAVVDTIGTETDLSVSYGTVAEFTALAGAINFGGCGSKVVNGTVTNVAATEFATVSLGYSFTIVTPAVSSAFQLTNVAEGPQDLVAVRSNATFAANKIILRRAQNIAGGGNLPVLDFNAAEAFAPTTANVTVTGLGTDEASITALFTGVRGSAFGLLSSITSYTAATGAVPYSAIPLAQLSANEFQQLSALASASGSSTSDRTAGVYFRSPVNQTLALGPALSTPTVTKVVTAPNARPRVQLPGQAEYNRLIFASYDQSGNNRSASVSATAGYFGGAPATWDVTLPDLSAAAGWNTAWGLLDGAPIDWDVSAQGGAIAFLDPTITDGSTGKSARVSSTTPLTMVALRTESNRFVLEGRLLDALRERNRSPLH